MKNKSSNIQFGWKVLLVTVIASLILSTVYQAIASSYDVSSYPPPGQLVNIGNHHLHIRCMGEGNPTVVMEAGISGSSLDWILVQPEIAKAARVCTYDRAGYGWSEEGPQPRDGKQVAAELHMLLLRAGILGKHILVGHSLGGLFVQLYASLYPEEVAGIVLVDSVTKEQSLRMNGKTYERNLKAITVFTSIVALSGLLRLANQPVSIIIDKLPSEYQSMARAIGLRSKAYRALADEMASFNKSQIETRKAGPLPDVPIIVLSSAVLRDFPPGFSVDIKSLWDELQNDLASQQSNVLHVIAEESGHYIHLDQPDLVIEAVVNMIGKINNQEN